MLFFFPFLKLVFIQRLCSLAGQLQKETKEVFSLDDMQTCPPNKMSIYVVGKLTQIYFCKGTPWRICIILRCVLLIGHLWREIAKWAFLWGAGGQNSLSELWTNTSLSPNLVIHSPVASLSFAKCCKTGILFPWTCILSATLDENRQKTDMIF